jgi:dipeptidyl aminopeptidase/acylaminoacyl peptidase
VVVDLQASTVRQLTHSFLGGLCADDLIKPELVHYPSFDGRPIPAFVYKPNEADGRMPVVVAIHGGPEWQERPDYKYVGLYQYLVSRGIAVLAPNIRGSTGYGLSYQKLIHRDWGGDDLHDIEAAAQYLHQLPWVDPQRIAVFGGSYGGFATLSAVARMPQWWCTGVDVFGPSNLITFVQNVPPHWRSLTDGLIGNPETDRDMLITRSPITYVDQITAPLFIIQGAKDPRVVQSESDQIVERLRALGRTVRYDVYPDEGHGFTKRANEVKVMGDIAAWLEAQLRARDAVLEM